MTDESPRPQTPNQRRTFGLVILGAGVMLTILVIVIVPAFHTPWAYLFLLLPVPNLIKGIYEIVASARARAESD